MRRILATLAVVGALLFGAGGAWADYDDGVAAAQIGDYARALQEFRALAEQGDARGQYSLGFMYELGRGVPLNDAEAVKWYRKAAEQGHADAQNNLDVMNDQTVGWDVAPDSSSVQTNDVNGISGWLRSIGLEKFEEKFLSNDITPDILPELTNADLKEIGINSLGARKRILKAIKEGPVTLATNVASAEDGLKPGDTFRDCPECPEIVVIPLGSFLMGSPESEEGRNFAEGPVHRVSVRQPFAIGKYEVTFAEWDACVSGGGCNGFRPDDEGYGRGKRPVINVSWEDAKSYTSWLSRKTGHTYRLPGEAEWEYAARAGTTSRYHFGDSISASRANFGQNNDGYVAIGSYPANAIGLHDVHGNVWEWVEDCWNNSYAGAPSDTNVWKTGNCSLRVVRGGSFVDFSSHVRSAIRLDWAIENRNNSVGFRIARTLP